MTLKESIGGEKKQRIQATNFKKKIEAAKSVSAKLSSCINYFCTRVSESHYCAVKGSPGRGEAIAGELEAEQQQEHVIEKPTTTPLPSLRAFFTPASRHTLAYWSYYTILGKRFERRC